MRKKIVLGASAIILFFSLLIFFFFKTSYDQKLIEKKKVNLIEKENTEFIEEKIESSNIIEDVSYSAKDANGNEYFLKAAEGTIDQNESNFII